MRRKRKEPEVPVNPLPPPLTGEVNMMDPVERTEEASWQPYKSRLGAAEPEGELDESGVLRDDDGTRRVDERPDRPPDRSGP